MNPIMKSIRRLMATCLVCCCVITPATVEAEDPVPPTSPTEVKLPKDNTKAVPQDASDGWTKIEASESTKGAKAKKIKVVIKKEANEPQTETIKVKKIGYYKKATNPAEYVEEDVTSTQSANGDESNIDIPDDADMTKAIYVKVYTYDKVSENNVIPDNCPLNKDFVYTAAGGDIIVSVEHGGDAVCSIDDEDEQTVLELAEEMMLSAEDFDEPDLMFWCTDVIETGVLLFCPLGQFEFSSIPEAIHVFDAAGGNLVTAGRIALNDAYLTPRGDLAIPVTEVDPTLPAFGMIVRGVDVDMDANADANSVHCYTTGGTSLRYLEGDSCPIAEGTRVLDNWEILPWSANYSLGVVTAAIGEEDSVTIGAPFITTVSGEENSGYLDGIVIEGNANNAIKNGKIVLRGVSGWQFEIEDGNPDTKVYLLNATTGADLYNEEISASIGANSHGDVVVSLNNIETYCASVRVKVVITGLQVAYTAPAPWGVGYKLECFGSSLRAPLRMPRVIIEGESPEVSEASGPLAQEPIEVTGWTPIAISE